MSEKMQYLQFIQAIITRHNSNSFAIKWMTIAVIAIFGACLGKMAVSIVLTALFWAMDAMYLAQERGYVALFNEAVKENALPYDLRGKKTYVSEAFFSKTLLVFYLSLMAGQALLWWF